MRSRALCVFLVLVCVVRMTTECGCVVSSCLFFFIYCLFYFFVIFFFVFVFAAFFLPRFCGIVCACIV